MLAKLLERLSYKFCRVSLLGIVPGVKADLIAMKTQKSDVVIRRLDEGRYAVAVDGIVRWHVVPGLSETR